MRAFPQLLAGAERGNRSMLCVGLDPEPAKFPAPWRGDARRILDFCTAIVDATHDLVCAFKPQVAYFAANRAEEQLERIASLPQEVATREMQDIYSEPIKPELIARRIAEVKEQKVVVAASLTPQRVRNYYEIALEAGLDVLVIYWAFKVNFRAAKASEEITVTPSELRVRRISHRGHVAEWVLNPLWVQLDQIEHEEFGIEKLYLVSRGRSVSIGSFLGPNEKARFAKALRAALQAARRGPTGHPRVDPGA